MVGFEDICVERSSGNTALFRAISFAEIRRDGRRNPEADRYAVHYLHSALETYRATDYLSSTDAKGLIERLDKAMEGSLFYDDYQRIKSMYYGMQDLRDEEIDLTKTKTGELIRYSVKPE